MLLKIHHPIVRLALKHEPCSLPIDITGSFIKFNRSETHPSFIILKCNRPNESSGNNSKLATIIPIPKKKISLLRFARYSINTKNKIFEKNFCQPIIQFSRAI